MAVVVMVNMDRGLKLRTEDWDALGYRGFMGVGFRVSWVCGLGFFGVWGLGFGVGSGVRGF